MKRIYESVGVGLVATLVMDILNRALAAAGLISVSRYEGIGRIFSNWFHGDFIHSEFSGLTAYRHELFTGILVHYAIGMVLAAIYILGTSAFLKSRPLGLAPVAYGAATSVFAWLAMFPAVGLGFFGLDAPPAIRLFRSSLCNHLSYGLGLLIGLHLFAALRKPDPPAARRASGVRPRSLVRD